MLLRMLVVSLTLFFIFLFFLSLSIDRTPCICYNSYRELISLQHLGWLLSTLKPCTAVSHTIKVLVQCTLSYLSKASRKGILMILLCLCFILFFSTLSFASRAPTTSWYMGWPRARVAPPHMPTCTWGGGSTIFFPVINSQCTCATLFHGMGTLMKSSVYLFVKKN